MNGVLIGVGLVYGLTYLANQAGTALYNLLPYEIIKTKFHKFSFDEVIIKSEILIRNKASYDVTVQGFIGGLFFREMEVSKISNFNQPFTIPAGGSVMFSIYFGFQPQTFFNQIAQLAASGTLFGNFKVKGNLVTDKATIPVNFTPDILPN